MGNLFVHQIIKGRKTKKQCLNQITSTLKQQVNLLHSRLNGKDISDVDIRGVLSDLADISSTDTNLREVYVVVEPKKDTEPADEWEKMYHRFLDN